MFSSAFIIFYNAFDYCLIPSSQLDGERPHWFVDLSLIHKPTLLKGCRSVFNVCLTFYFNHFTQVRGEVHLHNTYRGEIPVYLLPVYLLPCLPVTFLPVHLLSVPASNLLVVCSTNEGHCHCEMLNGSYWDH